VTEEITRVRGSNYFCVFDEAEFYATMSRDFAFNFFPFAFNAQLLISIASSSDEPGSEPKIGAVYGTPWATSASKPMIERWCPKTHCLFPPAFKATVWTLLMAQYKKAIPTLPTAILEHLLSFLSPQTCCGVEINTCFPSAIKESHVYGGPIVIEWTGQSEVSQERPQKLGIKFRITYNDRTGRTHAKGIVKTANITSVSDSFDSAAVKKAVLLQRYTSNIKGFLIAHESGSGAEEALTKLKRFSEIFSREATESGDPKLIKDAAALEAFVKREGLIPAGQCLVQ